MSQALVFERARRAQLLGKLHASETRLHALMGLTASGILIVDGVTGRIRDANDRCQDMFGYEVKELVGMSVEELLHLDLREKHVALRHGLLHSIRKREIGYHPPILATRKDGSEVDVIIGLTSTSSTDEVMAVCDCTVTEPQSSYPVKMPFSM